VGFFVLFCSTPPPHQSNPIDSLGLEWVGGFTVLSSPASKPLPRSINSTFPAPSVMSDLPSLFLQSRQSRAFWSPRVFAGSLLYFIFFLFFSFFLFLHLTFTSFCLFIFPNFFSFSFFFSSWSFKSETFRESRTLCQKRIPLPADPGHNQFHHIPSFLQSVSVRCASICLS